MDEEERQLDGLDQLEQFERYDLQLLVVHNFVHYEVVRLFYRPFRVQSLFGIVHLIVHLVDALVGLRHFILSKIYYKIMGNKNNRYAKHLQDKKYKAVGNNSCSVSEYSW